MDLGNSGNGYGQTKNCLPKKGTSAETVIQEILYHRHLRSSPGLKSDESPLIISREFLVENIDKDLFKHLINLFLELFGECEIRRSDLSSFIPYKVSKVNWHFLPPGEYPWDQVRSHTRNLVKNKDPRYSNVILARQDIITKYKPEEVFVGNGGFRAYIAYVFKEKRNSSLRKYPYRQTQTYVFWFRLGRCRYPDQSGGLKR